MDSEESNEWEETEYESLDWGDSENEGETSVVSLYPSTNKPNVAALLLIIAGFVLLGTATTMNGILNDGDKIQGVTVKYNEVMQEMGLEIDEEGEEIDESFVSNVIEVGMIWELVCAVLSFVGGCVTSHETKL